MLQNVDLNEKLTKKDAKPIIQKLQNEIILLQQKMKELNIPMMIVFDGWDCSGKASIVNCLVNQLDSRAYTVYAMEQPSEDELRKPMMWRYWEKVPVYGKMTIFAQSWYQEAAWRIFEKYDSDEEIKQIYRQINTFERQLVDDGYPIVKLFLHISKKTQKERQQEKLDNPITSWRVSSYDKVQNRKYGEFEEIFEDILQNTNMEYAPWHAIAAEDPQVCEVKFLQIIRDVMQNAILKKENNQYRIDIESKNQFARVEIPLLQDVFLKDKVLDDDEYKEKKRALGKRLRVLHDYLYKKQIPLLVLYEGWDAGGKGGNIRRLTEKLDPRGYRVIPTAAPDFVEKNHQYLWRFWRDLPKSGHIAIFDRTWYGRVMVERIEGFCREDEWKRAYREINEFEEALHQWGAIIVKFWIQIDQEEQLKRFNARQENPAKWWKITDEDWRNREKWPQYEEAVNDMLRETSTEYAPWTIIEGNDKKFARIKAMQTVVDTIEEKLVMDYNRADFDEED